MSPWYFVVGRCQCLKKFDQFHAICKIRCQVIHWAVAAPQLVVHTLGQRSLLHVQSVARQVLTGPSVGASSEHLRIVAVARIF